MAKKQKVSSAKSSRLKSANKSSSRPQAKGAPRTPRSMPVPSKRSSGSKPGVQAKPSNTTPPKMKTPDAVDLLVDDHLAVDAIFKKYDKLTEANAPAAQRQRLASEVCRMLKVHTQLEEEIFYPTVRSAGVEGDLLDEAEVEHASAKDMIKQIESMNAGDDLYDAKVKVLGEYIAHHVVEEHKEIFPKCRRLKIDLMSLRDQLEARKQELESTGRSAPAPEREGGLLRKLREAVTSE